MRKIWLVVPVEPRGCYELYQAVVVASSRREAREVLFEDKDDDEKFDVNVSLIGECLEDSVSRVVCSQFVMSPV